MFSPGGPTFRELMQQALASTERGYDLLAPKFDLTPFRTGLGLPAALLGATTVEACDAHALVTVENGNDLSQRLCGRRHARSER